MIIIIYSKTKYRNHLNRVVYYYNMYLLLEFQIGIILYNTTMPFPHVFDLDSVSSRSVYIPPLFGKAKKN